MHNAHVREHANTQLQLVLYIYTAAGTGGRGQLINQPWVAVKARRGQPPREPGLIAGPAPQRQKRTMGGGGSIGTRRSDMVRSARQPHDDHDDETHTHTTNISCVSMYVHMYERVWIRVSGAVCSMRT